jgi:mitotic-spindle organizing protein 1
VYKINNPRTALYQVSQLLNTGLDRETLAQCISLCEAGVNPEALAAVIRELRRETQAINQ